MMRAIPPKIIASPNMYESNKYLKIKPSTKETMEINTIRDEKRISMSNVIFGLGISLSDNFIS